MPIARVAPALNRITTIRFASDEYAKLVHLSALHSVSVSELVRRVVLDLGLPPQRLPRLNVEAVHQLAKAGANLNQIAHAFNRWAAVAKDERRQIWTLQEQTIAGLSRLVSELKTELLR